MAQLVQYLSLLRYISTAGYKAFNNKEGDSKVILQREYPLSECVLTEGTSSKSRLWVALFIIVLPFPT